MNGIYYLFSQLILEQELEYVGATLGHKTLASVKRYSHLSVAFTAKVLDRMNEEIFDRA